MIGVEDTVWSEENSLGWYVMNNAHEIMRSVEKDEIMKKIEVQYPKVRKRQYNEQHRKGWTDKPLHGQTINPTKDLMNKVKKWN